MKFLKDKAALLVCGVVASGGAWAFWHYAGMDGFIILLAISVFGLVADKRRLRRRVGELESRKGVH